VKTDWPHLMTSWWPNDVTTTEDLDDDAIDDGDPLGRKIEF